MAAPNHSFVPAQSAEVMRELFESVAHARQSLGRRQERIYSHKGRAERIAQENGTLSRRLRADGQGAAGEARLFQDKKLLNRPGPGGHKLINCAVLNGDAQVELDELKVGLVVQMRRRERRLVTNREIQVKAHKKAFRLCTLSAVPN
jgi:hypothetical protein